MRINDRITASEVRLISSTGDQVGVVSKGKTTISRIYHLDRGYEKIENKLKKIGVKIKRLK